MKRTDGSGLGFRFRISVRASVRVKYVDLLGNGQWVI